MERFIVFKMISAPGTWALAEFNEAINAYESTVFWSKNEQKVRDLANSMNKFYAATDEPPEVHPVDTPEVVTEPPKRKYKIGEEARARMAEGQRRRWAQHHKGGTPKSRNLSPEAIERIKKAQKKRWAAWRKANGRR